MYTDSAHGLSIKIYPGKNTKCPETTHRVPKVVLEGELPPVVIAV